MLILSTTQSNQVVLTLSEKTININPHYTWKLSNRDSLIEYFISPDNNSMSPYYDSFTISIGTPVSLTSSVKLNIPAGEYHYSVYEMPTQYDLDIDNAIGIAEVGLMIISGTSTPFISFTASEGFTFTTFDNY